MGLTDKLAGGRRRKLTEFLEDGHLEEGEQVEGSLPMLQTHFGRFAGYYGVALTPRRVLVVEWAKTVPERPTALVDSAPRAEVTVAENKRGMIGSKIVLARGGERWIGLKVPRIHRADADTIEDALS